MTTDPSIFGIPTADLALVVSTLALIVSGVSAGLTTWVARRDQAHAHIELRYANYHALGRTATPFLSITAANRGRRPVRLNSYGFAYSDHTLGTFLPYPAFALPKTLGEGESYSGLVPLRNIQEGVRSKAARLTAVYFTTDDGRRIRMRIWPWSKWHGRLRNGPLAPPPANEDLLLAPVTAGAFLEQGFGLSQ